MSGALKLSELIDEKDGTEHARDLMLRLMQGEREA